MVVTQVEPVGDFWEAEPEHQDYLEKYPDGYTCHFIRPEWTLPRPASSGTYYFRYRSIEPDGFVGPYSSTLLIEVPRDWRYLWLLTPLLILL